MTNPLAQLAKITLPLPPTDNRLRMPVKRGKNAQLVKTSEYRQWGQDAAIAWEEWARLNDWRLLYLPTEEQQLEFKYQLFLPNRRTDIGNYTKAIADFLGGNKTEAQRLFSDDHWIVLRLAAPVTLDKANPRVEIDPVPSILR